MTRPLRRWAAAPAALAIAALALTGCASFDDASSSSSDGDDPITVALTGEPASLDPILDGNLPALNVFYDVFDQLTTINSKGGVSPDLATKWSHNADSTVWTFEMNPKAKFQDGTAVTPQDVVFTYQQGASNPNSKIASYLTQVQKVEATGDHEVTFTLSAPFAPFDRQATLVPIVPQHVYEKDPAAFANQPVGSGPYSVVKWTHGDSVQLTRNDDYFGTKAAYKNVTFRFVADDTTRANSVQSGDLDIALLGPTQVAAVKKSGTVDVVDQQSNRVLYMGFSTNAAWLKDKTVREAADMAVDRDAISTKLMNGSVEPTGQLVAKASFGFDPKISATKYDPEKAKQLLKQSGYDGSTITLSYPTTGLPQIEQIAQANASYLQAVGFSVKLDGEEAGTYINDWYADDLPGFYLFAFAPSIMDADLPLTMLLKTGGQGYQSNPEIDQLLTAEIGEGDKDARLADLQKISEIQKENTYYAPLFIDTYTYASKKGLKWTPRPDGFFIFN